MASHSFNTTLAKRYSVEEAIIVEHLYFWIHKNECNDEMFKDGRVWCYSTLKGFEKYLEYFSCYQIRRILAKLEVRGKIKIGNYNKQATNQTLWYAFSDEFINELIALDFQFAKSQNGICEIAKSNNSIINNPINEYNTKENDKIRLSNDNQKSDEYSDDFLEFWKAYGYPKAKGTTYKRWKKLSVKDKKAALEALPLYFDDCKRHDRSKQYPATYLNKRTWEDGFDKNENENEESPVSVNEIPAADVKPWESVQQWLKDKTPGYADVVTYKEFTEMRGYAMFDAKSFADILIKMYESGYEGDIVSEFKRLFDEV